MEELARTHHNLSIKFKPLAAKQNYTGWYLTLLDFFAIFTAPAPTLALDAPVHLGEGWHYFILGIYLSTVANREFNLLHTTITRDEESWGTAAMRFTISLNWGKQFAIFLDQFIKNTSNKSNKIYRISMSFHIMIYLGNGSDSIRLAGHSFCSTLEFSTGGGRIACCLVWTPTVRLKRILLAIGWGLLGVLYGCIFL